MGKKMIQKVTIVIPTYNRLALLKETIDSILNQTLKDFQLIIVNDGSIDGTKDYLDSLSDPRIEVYHKENGGTGSALNMGFEHFNSDYGMFWADDNIMYPNCLEELYNYLENHQGVDFVYGVCDVKVFDDKGNMRACHSIKKELKSMEWDAYKYFECHNIGVVHLFRKELKEKAGLYDCKPCEDYTMVIKMILNGGKFRFLDKTLGWFRRHPNNISAELSKDSFTYTKNLINEMVKKRDEYLKNGGKL